MMVVALVPAAHAADAGSAPVLVNASNMSGPEITLQFDRYLQEGSLDTSKISLSGAPGVLVAQAIPENNRVRITLDKPLNEVMSVTIALASGFVQSEAGVPNAAVAGYKLQTLAGVVGILEAMNAKTYNPDVSHVLKYLRLPEIGNVAAGDGIGSEDVRFLMSMLDAEVTYRPYMSGLIALAVDAISHTGTTSPERVELEGRLIAAKAAYEKPDVKLYELSLATLNLNKAYYRYLVTIVAPTDQELAAIGTTALLQIQKIGGTELNRIYVPHNMTAAQLAAAVESQYGYTIRASSAADAPEVSGSTVLTKNMVVRVNLAGSKAYEIRPQRAVSTYAELASAAGDSSLRAIFISNDISAPEQELAIQEGMVFRADHPVRVTIKKKISTWMAWEGNVYFVAYAANDTDLLAAVNAMGFNEIVADGIGAFSGTLSIHHQDGQWQYYKLGTTAYVGNKEHLLRALADSTVTKVYFPGNVTVESAVTFPARSIELVGSAERQLTAYAYKNSLTGSLANVSLVTYPGLYKSGSNADVSIESSWDANVPDSLYVPYGMTAAQLLEEVSAGFPYGIKASSATDAADVTGSVTLKSGMVVRIDAAGSKPYAIKPQVTVANATELAAAAGNAEVGAIQIANNIVARQESFSLTGKDLRASTYVRLEVGDIAGMNTRSGYITLVGYADNDAELLMLTGKPFFNEIILKDVGTMVAKWGSPGGFYFAMGSTAYVGNEHHLVAALAAEEIGAIYLVADVTVAANVPLTFPERSVSLIASTPRVLKANATNELNGSYENVKLVASTEQPGFGAYLGDFNVVEDNLYGFKVHFTQSLAAVTLGKTADELIESVSFLRIGDDGTALQVITPQDSEIAIEWDDAAPQTMEIALQGIPWEGLSITVNFVDHTVKGVSDPYTWMNTVKYGADPIFSDIRNIVAEDGQLVSFEIMFNEPLSSGTLALDPSAALVGIELMRPVSGWEQLEAASMAWVGGNALLITLAEGYSDEYYEIEAMLNADAIVSMNGGRLYNDIVSYMNEYANYLIGEITSFNDGDGYINITVQFSEPVSEATAGLEASALLESVKVYGMGGPVSWEPGNTSIDATFDDNDSSILYIHFYSGGEFPDPDGIAVAFVEDSVTGQSGGYLYNNPVIVGEAVEPDMGEVEVSSKYSEVYVPYGMTVGELADYLNSEYPNHEIRYEEAIAEEEAAVTSAMVVVLDKNDGESPTYRLLVHGTASSLDGVMYWITRTEVDVVTLAADFSYGEFNELYVNRPIWLRSAEPITVELEILYMEGIESYDFGTYEEVTLIVSVNGDEEIIYLANLDNISHLSSTITGYEGIYVRNTKAEKYYYVNANGAAIVYNAASLEDAIEDSSVTRIYIADDINWPIGETLSIPSRITHLKSMENHTIAAGTIAFYSTLIWSETITLGGEHQVTDNTAPVITGAHVNTTTNTVMVYVEDGTATVYIVEDGTVITDVSQLTAALRSVSVSNGSAVFSDFHLLTDEGNKRYFRAYAVDAEGNLSAISDLIDFNKSA